MVGYIVMFAVNRCAANASHWADALPVEVNMKHYKFDKDRGVVDEADNQVLQLVGGTNKFRKLCGTLLVERLNVKARGDAATQQGVQADEVMRFCPECGASYSKRRFAEHLNAEHPRHR